MGIRAAHIGIASPSFGKAANRASQEEEKDQEAASGSGPQALPGEQEKEVHAPAPTNQSAP
jgi:hypothetical protein